VPSTSESRPSTTLLHLLMIVPAARGEEREPFVRFYLAGTFDPDGISRKLGVAPSQTRRAGNPIGRSGTKRRNSIWAFHLRLQPSDRIELEIEDILDQLDSNRASFEELSHEVEGIVEVVGLSRDYAPQFAWSRRFSRGWRNMAQAGRSSLVVDKSLVNTPHESEAFAV
jgi:hypothetical protein